MKKEDNDWEIKETKGTARLVELNGEAYYVSHDASCMAHCLLLLVDAINDKSFKCNS